MKRLSVLLLCLVMCAASFAQENEHSFLVVPRLEANPYIGGNQTFDMGNTSLYTLFEGELSETFSYSVMNHWLSADPASLYANTFRSDDFNWLDWAYVSAYVGNFNIDLGKQALLFGMWEQDDYDFDVCYNLSSTVWNTLSTYLWGIILGYSFDDTYLAAQVTTSPFAEYHLSGCFAYSLAWKGEYDDYEPVWSFNVFEYAAYFEGDLLPSPRKAGNIYSFAAGNRFNFDEWQLDFDFNARSYDLASLFKEEISLIASLKYFIDDKFDVMLKGGWERNRSGEDVFGYMDEPGFLPTSLAWMKAATGKDYLFGGLLLNYYPLDDEESLRLHGALAANNYAKGLSVTIGATYYLDLFELLDR